MGVSTTNPPMCGKWKFWMEVIVLYILWENIKATECADQDSSSCTLPPHPKHGRWSVLQASYPLHPAEVVAANTVLEVTCDSNHKIDGAELVACVRGQWRPEMGQCLRTCVSLHSTTTTTVSCSYKGKLLKECIHVASGTVAQFQCAPFYEIDGQDKRSVRTCSDGRWEGGLPECVPVCGKKGITQDPTLIVGGMNTTSLEYPWQAALYMNDTKSLICGGTLLNQKTILTAAHCVTDVNGKLLQKEFYIVAVGKTYRSFNDSRDFTAQFSSIEAMFIPPEYKGYIQRFAGDLALIITTKTLTFTASVQPICVVLDKAFHKSLENATVTNSTYVSGWGFTAEYKDPSDVLKSLQVPLITNEQCERNLAEDDVEYLTSDKLCAGFTDAGQSVCKGDSGGGLVGKYGDRYYIMGIVSIAPQASSEVGGCDSQKYGLYTKFSSYIEDFTGNIINRYKLQEHVDCIDCVVQPSANATGSSGSKTESVPCRTSYGENGVCKAPRDCSIYPPIFEDEVHNLNQCGLSNLCCPNNSAIFVPQTHLLPEKSECGTSGNTSLNEFTWMALLEYESGNGTSYFGCGGALISKRYVLTARHCLRKALKSVRLGEWNLTSNPDCIKQASAMDCAPEATDIGIAQMIPFRDIFDFVADIGLIRLDQDVKFNDFLKPICLPTTTSESLQPQAKQNLVIAGWGLTKPKSEGVKRKVSVSTVPIAWCAAKLGQAFHTKNRFLQKFQICVAGETVKENCTGDSGGPLMYSLDSKWYIGGVFSLGAKNLCAKDSNPSIYVNVYTYIRWIIRNLKPYAQKNEWLWEL